MIQGIIISIVGLIAIAGFFLREKFINNKIEKLQEKRTTENVELKTLENQATNLKDEVNKEQSNATEKQKVDFWEEHLVTPDRK